MRESLPKNRVELVPHPRPTDEDSDEAWHYAWLLAQIAAMESSDAVIAVGGKISGPMSFLLHLAEARRKTLLPLRFLGGTAADCYERQRFVLVDQLRGQTDILNHHEDIGRITSLLDQLVEAKTGRASENHLPRVFISYPKARPIDADFVEVVLRRRSITVLRDERDFSPGSPIVAEINKYIKQADIFIAMWCNEYACSPWCCDELEVAISHMGVNNAAIWLICVDETRIVPRCARGILAYPVRTRQDLEGKIITLLEKWRNSRAAN